MQKNNRSRILHVLAGSINDNGQYLIFSSETGSKNIQPVLIAFINRSAQDLRKASRNGHYQVPGENGSLFAADKSGASSGAE